MKKVVVDWLNKASSTVRLDADDRSTCGLQHDTTGQLLCPIEYDWSDLEYMFYYIYDPSNLMFLFLVCVQSSAMAKKAMTHLAVSMSDVSTKAATVIPITLRMASFEVRFLSRYAQQ